jgi:WD40 repeat protein
MQDQDVSYPVTAVAFSPDGRTIVSGTLSSIKVWDAVSGRELRKLNEDLDLYDTGASAVAFSPDGRTVVSGSDRGTLRLWDMASGRELRTLTDWAGWVSALAFSPDGRTIASVNADGILKIWDATSGRELLALAREGSNFKAVAFAPDGRTIISGSDDKTLKLWDATSGRALRRLGRQVQEVSSVAFSPDGREVVSGSRDNTLKLWDATSGRELRTLSGHNGWVNAVAFSPDGRAIVSGSADATLKLWDAESGRELRTLPTLGEKPLNGWSVSAVAFSPDGRTIAGGSGLVLKLWSAASERELRTLTGHTNYVSAVAFSPNGVTIVSGSGDATLKLWDAASGQELRTLTGLAGWVSTVAFSPDGHTIVSGGGDGVLQLWDAASGHELRTLSGHTDWVYSVAISPDSSTIVSGSKDNTVKLWDAATGRELRTLTGHLGTVYSVAFSPDGRTIASGSADGTRRLWEAATGLPLLSEIAFDDGEWVAITPEGFFDASEGGAKHLTVVRGLTPYALDQFYDAFHRPDLVREKLAGDPDGKVREAAAKLDLSKAVASGNAPHVSIVAQTLQTTEEQVSVEASVADQGGGVGKIEWRVNGTTQGVEKPSTDRSFSGTIAIKKTLRLEPGENRIEIVAYNGQGLIASDPADVVVTLQSGAAAAAPRLYVLAVGVNDYWDSRLRLAFAVPDAQALGDALRKAGENLYERVEVTMALDAQATAPALERTFSDLAQKVRPQDAFVFFLSGHGKTVDGRFYFIPQDFHYTGEDSITAKAIGQDQLQRWFAEIPARKSVLLFDACESGSLTEDQNKAVGRGLEELTAIDRLTRAMGRTVLTATTDDKPAAEGVGGHGVFTYALLKAIGEAQADSDGLIGVTELASYVDRSVPELSYAAWKIRQVPQMRIIGSNFPLVRKVAILNEAGAEPPSIPLKPTHVVIASAVVHPAGSESAPVLVELTPGTQVRVIESSGDWVIVAREGKKLGYVQAKTLAGLQ